MLRESENCTRRNIRKNNSREIKEIKVNDIFHSIADKITVILKINIQ